MIWPSKENIEIISLKKKKTIKGVFRFNSLQYFKWIDDVSFDKSSKYLKKNVLEIRLLDKNRKNYKHCIYSTFKLNK